MGGQLDADVAVVGAGPAGCAMAAACARLGLDTVLVAPDPGRVWSNTYGCWLDELRPLGLASTVRASWPTVRVVGDRVHTLARPYGVLDNASLHRQMRDQLVRGGGRTMAGVAVGAQHFSWGSRVLLEDGHHLDVHLAVDAGGAGGTLLAKVGPPAAFQAAYGLIGRFSSPPVPPGSCTLMDWSPPGIEAGDDERHPTFLYAMDLGSGRFLVEETSLARRPALGRAELRRRLHARMARIGAQPEEGAVEEHVLIPVGARVPPEQPAAATGAAAGLVHPATGYSVAAGLRVAPVVAAVIRAHLDQPAGPALLSEAVWRAVWPSDRRRARRLEQFGLMRLLAMPASDVRAFFDAFFSLPVERWSPYLSGTASASHVARTMAALFRVAPWSVRRRLALPG